METVLFVKKVWYQYGWLWLAAVKLRIVRRATDAAAQAKKRRYAALAHAEGAEFVPFIVETFGGFGKEARDFISDLAIFASITSQVWSAAETRLMVRSEILRPSPSCCPSPLALRP